jgi:hypothetical protein
MSDGSRIGRLLADADEVLEDGVFEWANRRTGHEREQRHASITDDRAEFDSLDRDPGVDLPLSQEARREVKRKFAGAKLFLAAADYKDRGADSLLAEEYEVETLELLLDYAQYRSFTALDEERLKDRITDRDDRLYGLVRDEIVSQESALRRVRRSQENELSKREIEFLDDCYRQRSEKLEEAVALYVRERGVSEVVDDIERAAVAASDAAAGRQEVHERLEAELERFETQLRSSLREQHQLLRSRLDAMDGGDGEVESLREEVRELLDRHEARNEALDEHLDRVASLEADLDEHLSTLESLREETAPDSEVADLVEAELDRLREEKSTIVAEVERSRRERARLEAEVEELRAEQASDGPDDGAEEEEDAATLVPATVARVAELHFVASFREALSGTRELRLPDGETFEVPEGYWTDRYVTADDGDRLRELLPADADPETYPANKRSRHTVTVPKYLGLSLSDPLVIEARSVSHLETYATAGADRRPADLSDLLGGVDALVERTEGYGNGTTYLVGLGSPTGWTDRAAAALDDEGLRLGSQVRVCLVDLAAGRLHYDEDDPLLTAHTDLFEGALEHERVADCARAIHETYLADGMEGVTFEAVRSELDYEPHIIKRAFNRLQADGVGTQFETDDGLGLSFD